MQALICVHKCDIKKKKLKNNKRLQVAFTHARVNMGALFP